MLFERSLLEEAEAVLPIAETGVAISYTCNWY
jgi:hypothetical protein